MAHRKVRFEDGEWDVWDVRPEVRAHSLGSGLQNGWLCFQCGAERRRLTPIPEGWDGLEDSQLRPLFEKARPVSPVRHTGTVNPPDEFRAINITKDTEAGD